MTNTETIQALVEQFGVKEYLRRLSREICDLFGSVDTHEARVEKILEYRLAAALASRPPQQKDEEKHDHARADGQPPDSEDARTAPTAEAGGDRPIPPLSLPPFSDMRRVLITATALCEQMDAAYAKQRDYTNQNAAAAVTENMRANKAEGENVRLHEMIEAMVMAAHGEGVRDFLLSFPEVRTVADLFLAVSRPPAAETPLWVNGAERLRDCVEAGYISHALHCNYAGTKGSFCNCGIAQLLAALKARAASRPSAEPEKER